MDLLLGFSVIFLAITCLPFVGIAIARAIVIKLIAKLLNLIHR